MTAYLFLVNVPQGAPMTAALLGVAGVGRLVCRVSSHAALTVTPRATGAGNELDQT